MNIFHRKRMSASTPEYPSELYAAAVRSSICTGEKVAGFQNRETGKFTELFLLRSPSDLDEFCREYDVDPSDIRTIY